MKICVIGWYGTETVGDRAILDGILQIYGRLETDIVCKIGSLYPFFTKRTLLLDNKIYQTNVKCCEIKCFDVKQKDILKKEISDSDLVLMGGGPLMDLLELKIIEFAFKYAKNIKKKTIIFGCGLGPLKIPYYQKTVKNILSYSDLIIYRDQKSEDLASALYGEIFKNKTYVICDPAIFSIVKYKNENIPIKNKNIVINFRSVTSEYSEQHHIDLFLNIINWASEHFEKVDLIPMHTFAIGGDDRQLFAELLLKNKKDNVNYYSYPLTLYETYKIFSDSCACIGMRYHSVVMQTILNGNNFILDYTEKKIGKISGFLSQVDNDNFYSHNRLINIAEPVNFDTELFLCNLLKDRYFSYDFEEMYISDMNKYITVLKNKGV